MIILFAVVHAMANILTTGKNVLSGIPLTGVLLTSVHESGALAAPGFSAGVKPPLGEPCQQLGRST